MTRRVAVVLFNLGGPDSLKAVRPFLFNLFNDRAIITLPQPGRWLIAQLISRLRDKTAQEIYGHMGGKSPLLEETRAQADALQTELQAALPDTAVKVVIGMRYWRPFTADAAREVAAFKPDDVVLLPLYPQFSTTTTGSSLGEWTRVYRGGGISHAVCCYPDDEGLADAHVATIRTVLQGRDIKGLRMIFSAHGLPEKVILNGDPYQDQIERSAAVLAARLGVVDWRVCYQSRVGPMAWIGPSTIETIEEAGRDGVGVVVTPIAFVSEHSETLVELDRDYRELAERCGVPLYLRAPAVGVAQGFISALCRMTVSVLGESGVAPGAGSCRKQFPQCPFLARAA